MSSVDLNIIQRGAASDFNWTAGPGRITAADLGNIGEQRTDNGGALNALPTPFARFYIFKEAFRRVLEERNNPSKQAGRAYERLVSNCLDVFELLYNKNYHENLWQGTGLKIVIKEWNYSDDLKTLKTAVPILGTAIESYFNDDLGEKKLFFIILEQDGKEYLLATSSPFTGFITPPDMDLKEVKDDEKGGSARKMIFVGENYHTLKPIYRESSGKYFQDIQLFDKRPAAFKNYMYNFLFGNGDTLDAKYNELRDYIQSFQSDPEIKSNWEATSLSPIFSDDNSAIEVNGVNVMTSKDLKSLNYFSEAIIKVPYRLSSSKFQTMEFVNENSKRDYDYLIPLSSQAFEVIEKGDLTAVCQEKNKAVEVIFKHNGEEFKKTYRAETSAVKSGEGVIISLDTAKVNFDLALFPNVLSTKTEENNYFKVLVSAFDGNDRRTFTANNISLDFYRDCEGKFQIIETATDNTFDSGVKPAFVRSQQGLNIDCGSKFYEVFNTNFDAVLATVTIDSKDYTFALFPIWDIAVQSDKVFEYAIDFGTSNTYISRKEKGEMNEPQQLTMDKPIVSYLHDKAGSTQQNPVLCWENNTPDVFKTAFKTEFVPPYIDGKAYRFPIRTALCFTGEDASKLSLFDNSNIAFFYEKSKPAANQRIITNIKWSSDEKCLRVFIRELLLIIKADILQENGIISKTGVIWFRPLSFKETERATFEKIWTEEAKYILNIESTKEQIKCYTESEAPYYYFNAKDEYKSVESVAIVDIGGGSTDFVYFQKGEPKIANSVHFGCDVMWGNAFDKFKNSKKNGIYNKYKDTIGFDTDSLKSLNSHMISNNESTTQDIINFWISNNVETKIADKLRNDFAFAFAYHFTATVYYLASMLNAKKLSYPRTITFSGNGSRYIDQYITSNETLLTEITHLVMSRVFGKEINDIQLVLPEIRKESTCYGGLYHKEGAQQPISVVYYGDGSEYECEDVNELVSKYKTDIKTNVISQIKAMNNVYKEVLGLLIRKGAVSGQIVADKVLELVNDGIADVLDSKLQTEIIDVYSGQEQYNDTLFFIPVTDALLQLTNYKA